jgi:hypothetical protein
MNKFIHPHLGFFPEIHQGGFIPFYHVLEIRHRVVVGGKNIESPPPFDSMLHLPRLCPGMVLDDFIKNAGIPVALVFEEGVGGRGGVDDIYEQGQLLDGHGVLL